MNANKIISKKVLFVVTIIFLILATIFGLHKFVIYKFATLPTSHIYVSDNTNHKSDFDKWLTEDLQIDWVPSYVIINNKKVIGVINGNIPYNELNTKIDNCFNLYYEYCDLTNFEISNINGERKSFNDIIPDNGFYILEISWYGCDDCEYQDKHFTNNIYLNYSKYRFYRYYINSKLSDVQTMYKK